MVSKSNIGFVSGLNYKTEDYREGAIEFAYARFREEKVSFMVVAGGLVSQQKLKEEGLLPSKREDQQKFAQQLAEELAQILPQGRWSNDKEPTKIYVVTSDVKRYDGYVGTEIAKYLAALRDDVRFYGVGHRTIPIKGLKQSLRVLVPERALWATDFYSRPAQRMIDDDLKRSHSSLPMFYVGGCTASNVYKHQGEAKRPYMTLPNLCKIEQLYTAENQIGVRVVEVTHDGYIMPRTYSLKDLIQRERQFVPIPDQATELEKKIFSVIGERGKLPVGVIADFIDYDPAEVKKAIQAMEQSPITGISFDEASHTYDFRQDWLQKNVRYPWPKPEEMQTENLVAGACFHAGSIYTDEKFLLQSLPRFIAKQKISRLVVPGDFIEAWEHGLLQKQEVAAGMNITQMEKLAAVLVAELLLRVFDKRFKKILPKNEVAVGKHVQDALLDLYFISGNHDQWEEVKGHVPLQIFRYKLFDYLHSSIEERLRKRGLSLAGLREVVQEKLHFGPKAPLGPELNMEQFHLHLSRTKTHSQRSQNTLEISDAQVTVSANYHTALCVEHWQEDLGQRVALQVPTIKVSSDFEYNKGKVLDFGVGMLRVKSYQGRIYVTESMFFGVPGMTREEARKAKNPGIFYQRLLKAGIPKKEIDAIWEE